MPDRFQIYMVSNHYLSMTSIVTAYTPKYICIQSNTLIKICFQVEYKLHCIPAIVRVQFSTFGEFDVLRLVDFPLNNFQIDLNFGVCSRNTEQFDIVSISIKISYLSIRFKEIKLKILFL